jgi:hypothetical protein
MNRKAKILIELARSRAAIARDTASVRSELDLAAKLKNSVKARPFAWLGSAAAIGYILAGPKTRTKTVTKFVRGNSQAPAKAETKKSHGFWNLLLALLKLAVPVLRPALSAYAAKRFGDFSEKLGK